MSDKLTWKAEIKFRGTVKEFNQFAEMLEKAPVEVNIPEWIKIPQHLAGCFPFPVESILTRDQIKKITADMQVVQLKYVRDIRGGIRSPHLHIEDQIVLLDRDRFKIMVKNVAEQLAEMRVDRMDDYIDVMKVVNEIGRMGPRVHS